MSVIAGGEPAPGFFALSDCKAFDPVASRWLPFARMPYTRKRHSVVRVGGRLFVTGGFCGEKGAARKTVVCYDPASNTWTQLADMAVGCEHHTAVAHGGYIYVTGGIADNPTRKGCSFLSSAMTRG